MEREFTGKVAVVAGGSLGMGKAAARRLGQAGASVVICGRRQEHVDAAVGEMTAEGLSVDGLGDVCPSLQLVQAAIVQKSLCGGVAACALKGKECLLLLWRRQPPEYVGTFRIGSDQRRRLDEL